MCSCFYRVSICVSTSNQDLPMESKEERVDAAMSIHLSEGKTPRDTTWTNDDGTRVKYVVEDALDEDAEDGECEEEDDIKQEELRMIENLNTPQLMQEILELWRPRIGHHFSTADDFETFMKLPIPSESRLKLLNMVRANVRNTSSNPRRSVKRRAKSDVH